MKTGNWNVDAVVAGMFRLDGGAMFGVVPKTLWSKVAPADDKNRISMAMRTLVIRGEGKTVLIDAGAGRGYGEKLEKIYAFGNFAPLVEGLGLGPDDVIDYCKEHMAAYKRPRWVDFVEELPKTATGKIQRYRLRRDDRVQ